MLHKALTINMPRISHVSKESMISGATESAVEDGETPDDSPGQEERGPYEQG